MTQKERVLDYIDRFGSITQKEAFEDLGCMRLAARIADIEADGSPLQDIRKNRRTDSASLCLIHAIGGQKNAETVYRVHQ